MIEPRLVIIGEHRSKAESTNKKKVSEEKNNFRQKRANCNKLGMTEGKRHRKREKGKKTAESDRGKSLAKSNEKMSSSVPLFHICSLHGRFLQALNIPNLTNLSSKFSPPPGPPPSPKSPSYQTSSHSFQPPLHPFWLLVVHWKEKKASTFLNKESISISLRFSMILSHFSYLNRTLYLWMKSILLLQRYLFNIIMTIHLDRSSFDILSRRWQLDLQRARSLCLLLLLLLPPQIAPTNPLAKATGFSVFAPWILGFALALTMTVR